MSLSIDNIYSSLLNSSSTQTSSLLGTSNSLESMASTSELQNTIENAQSDEELMDACKSFEQYFLEQVFKGMQDTIDKSEDEESEYTSMFSDMMTEQYAKSAVDAQGYGVAQMLYESMKNNQK